MKIKLIKISFEDHSGLIKSDMIKEFEHGLYLGHSKNYYGRNSTYVTEVLNQNVLNKPTMMQIKGCSIYRFPKLSLPRQKVDHLKESANISVTRDKEKADYHIISEKLLDSFFESSWSDFITKEKMTELLSTTQSCYTNDGYMKISNMMEDDVLYYIQVDSHWRNQNPHLTKIRDAHNKATKSVDRGYSIYVPNKNLDDYNNIISNPKLVLDQHIKELCDEGLHILTSEEATNIEKILSTNDVENLTLALEMMSNCNLEKSFDYVSYLYYFNHDNLKMASNWNNINAKTLRSSLDNFTPYSNNSAIYYEAYLKKLVEANKLTEWAFKATAKKMFDGGMKSFGLNKDVFTIKLENIELNPKYAEVMKKAETAEEIIQELTGDPAYDDLPF
tara:strand:- start:2165 stop:3331 length:1167 start_codon:yes stop_codon:yes gene_type:complete